MLMNQIKASKSEELHIAGELSEAISICRHGDVRETTTTTRGNKSP